MSAEAKIEREDGPTKGRLFLRSAGDEAELTWSVVNTHHIIADHTYVPDAMRGTGTGTRLIERLVSDARRTGTKITPLCPFVQAFAARHPEWSDVFV